MIQIKSKLPEYVFEEKYDKYYFMYFDHVFFDCHNIFSQSIKDFLQLNSDDQLIIEELGQHHTVQLTINAADIKEKLFNYTPNKDVHKFSNEQYLHVIAENLIMYSNAKDWCFYFDRILELGICAMKSSRSSNFITCFNEKELFLESISNYFNWLRQVYNKNPKETEDFISKFTVNYCG